MNKRLLKVFSFTAIFTILLNSFVFAQTSQVKDAEARIAAVLQRSGQLFNEGLLALEKDRSQAREKFDRSIEVFLSSTLDVNRNAKMNACYNELVETIYRIEFPTKDRQPQIGKLSTTCDWRIQQTTIDSVAKLIFAVPTENTPLGSTLVNPQTTAEQTSPTQGFVEQKFEKAAGDELATLELTQDEINVETPEAQQQYQVITYAVSNNSLGLKFQPHPMIQQYINYYQGRGRSTMETGLYRSGMFMRMARQIFREEGIPENVAWLGQVESMWKPHALSWASASGLWQFIPGTGARYGLRRTAYLDERNSFEKATQASARYLKFLANRYNGNWELAMAAYNSGEGNVDRAISRAGVANFWVAYPFLPKETRNYVPNILATILIANNPKFYGFGNVRPAPQLQYERVLVPPTTSLAMIAQISDTTVDYIRYLNPEFRANTTPPEPYIVRVPQGKGNNVVAVFRRLPNNNKNTAAVTKSVQGETWENISNRTGIPVAELMAANNGMKQPQGTIVIPNGNKVKNTSYQRPTTPNPNPVNNGLLTVKAVAGDTVAKLAARYKVSAVEVANLNGFSSVNATLPAGREMKIPGK